MKTKIYHGDLDPEEMAITLANFFNRGGLAAQSSVNGETAFVQIASRAGRGSGGRISIGVALAQRGERIEASVGDQSVLGLAGSLLGKLTPSCDADMQNVSLYWHFMALTVLVGAGFLAYAVAVFATGALDMRQLRSFLRRRTPPPGPL